MDIVDQHLQQAFVTLLGAIVTGSVAVIGAWVNSFVTKSKQQARDYGAAEEKIRQLQRRLGITESKCLKSPDEIHEAIREIEKKVNHG